MEQASESTIWQRPAAGPSTWPRAVAKALGLVAITILAAMVPVISRILSWNRPSSVAWWGSRASRLWSRALCRLLGIRVLAEGGPEGPGPFLVASNHLSYLDILVLGSLYPSIFVAKREIRGWPFLGWIARAAGTLFVDRNNARDAVRAIQDLEQRLQWGVSVTIFPEAGTSRGLSVRPFQAALLQPAARTGVPCYAAAISYETPGEPAPPSDTVCWTDGRNFLWHLLGVARMRRIDAHVTFSPGPVSGSDRKELARRLWEASVTAFQPVRQRRIEA